MNSFETFSVDILFDLTQAEAMDDEQYVLAKDGLVARKSGEWARRKHHFLNNYCGIATTSMKKKWRLAYLDVMAGPGRCIKKDNNEEFPGSPFVALDHDFDFYYFIEENSDSCGALKKRLANHPKAAKIKVFQESWIDLAQSGKLRFDNKTLVVAFIDPTGIKQIPLKAVLELAKNRPIDMLVTLQYKLSISWNIHQYIKMPEGKAALDSFLGFTEWREWPTHNAMDFTFRVVNAFTDRMKQEGFIGTHHVSVPENNPIYSFTLYTRHPLGESFWNKVLMIDEKGQRRLF